MNLSFLMVEDSPVCTDVIGKALHTEFPGSRIALARDRSEYLCRLDAGDFDGIRSDQSLGSFSGAEALELAAVRQPDVPFVFVTGTVSAEQAIELMRRGALDVVFKDRLTRLGAAIRQAAEERRARLERRRTREALAVKTRELEAIRDAMSAFVDTGDLQRASVALTTHAMRETGSRNAFVAITDGDQLRVFAEGGDSRSCDVSAAESLMAAVVRQRGAVIENSRTASVLAVPIVAGDATIGVLVAQGCPGGYALEQRERLEALAHTASMLCEAHRRQIAEGALHDQLRQARKMEAIGRLASGVAHDLNNMLCVVQGYADLLHDSSNSAVIATELKQIQKATHRGASLTRQLLALSRRQKLQPAVLDLNHTVTELCRLLTRVISEDIQVEIKPSENLSRVLADPAQVEQVVMNLVLNARDAITGGGRITIATQDVSLPKSAGHYVLLTVTDTGCGMDEETRSRIFEPFFTTKAPGHGTGLGLATVYGIVKQSQGHISVDSRPGEGTTFRVYLPVPAESQAMGASPVAPASPKPARPGETVLVVEDDADLRRLTCLTLEKRGYRVLQASGAQDACRISAEVDCLDLLITDIVMPGNNGVELALRLQQQRSELRVLLLSGYPSADLNARVKLDPSVPFIAKPYSADVLARRVREILDGAPLATAC